MISLPPNRFRPASGNAVAFIDGQNLFKSVKECFGYTYPNYDVVALTAAVCAAAGWTAREVRFYTGIPSTAQHRDLNGFWSAKFAAMGRQGVKIFWRHLKTRDKTIVLPDGSRHTYSFWQEKGVDVRLALDAVTMAYRGEYDIAIIFSQDQDLSEIVNDVRDAARIQNRRMWVACAFPCSTTASNRRGMDKSDWVQIGKADYDLCVDPRDYRRSAPALTSMP
jgi:uncharacterized LabA/DUF88 family protein